MSNVSVVVPPLKDEEKVRTETLRLLSLARGRLYSVIDDLNIAAVHLDELGSKRRSATTHAMAQIASSIHEVIEAQVDGIIADERAERAR